MCYPVNTYDNLKLLNIFFMEVVIEKIEIHRGPHMNTLDYYKRPPSRSPSPPPAQPRKSKTPKKSKSRTKSPEPPISLPPPMPEPKPRVGPPLRVSINIFSFENVYVTQVDLEEALKGVDPDSCDPKKEKLIQEVDEEDAGKFAKCELDTDFSFLRPPKEPESNQSRRTSKSRGTSVSFEMEEQQPVGPPPPEIPDPGCDWDIKSPTSFRRGMSAIFIAKPEDLIKYMQKSPLKIKVDRFDGEESYEVGQTTVKLPNTFQTTLLTPFGIPTQPRCNYIDGTYPLKDPQGEEIGVMELFFGLTGYGGQVEADFLASEKGLYTLMNESNSTSVCNKPDGRNVMICQFSEPL